MIIWTDAEAFSGERQDATLIQHSKRLPLHGVLLIRQHDKFIGLRLCCCVIAAEVRTKLVLSSVNIKVPARPGWGNAPAALCQVLVRSDHFDVVHNVRAKPGVGAAAKFQSVLPRRKSLDH